MSAAISQSARGARGGAGPTVFEIAAHQRSPSDSDAQRTPYSASSGPASWFSFRWNPTPITPANITAAAITRTRRYRTPVDAVASSRIA